MTALLLLCACWTRADRPVPPHGDLEAVRAAVVDQRPEDRASALEPFQVIENGLREPAATIWMFQVRQAWELARARRPSEIRTAYARFVVTCARCHAGEPVQVEPGKGHGRGLVALEQGIVHDDAGSLAAAVEAIGRDSALPQVQKRFVQLAERIRTDDRPAVRADALQDLYGYCLRCHGPSSPVQLSGAP